MTGAAAMMLSGGPQIVADNQGISDFGIDPQDASAHYQVRSDGSVWRIRTTQSDDELEKWLSPPGAAPGSYEINVTSSGDALTAGSDSTGVDLALTSNRSWGIESTAVGPAKNATLTVRYKLGGSILKTVTVTLTTQVEP